MCCCLHGFCGLLLAAAFGLLMVPAIEDAYSHFVMTNMTGTARVVGGQILTARQFVYCLGDYLGCVKDELADDFTKIYTWEKGIGELVSFSPSIQWYGPASSRTAAVHFSHKAYRDVAHNPKAGRPPDMFIFSNVSGLPVGVLPDGDPPTILLHFDTGTKEHTARRKLLADALPALAQHPPSVPELVVPPGVKASAAAVFGPPMGGLAYRGLKRAVFDLVGYNIYLQLFGVDIKDLLELHFEYDGTLAPVVIGMPILASGAARLAEIRGKIMERVAAGEVAQKFMAEAKARGMDGRERLSEMNWISMFAGYGGTSNLATETLKRILRDPAKYVKLFRKDPDAFMLEAARLHPPVGGMNPFAYRQHISEVLANGVTLKRAPGDIGIIFSSNSNHDPAVFKDPEAFLPGRENADRLFSWNNELRDFKTCETVLGCPAAPRGCPGTWLSLRVATAAVTFFVGGIEEALAAKKPQGEL